MNILALIFTVGALFVSIWLLEIAAAFICLNSAGENISRGQSASFFDQHHNKTAEQDKDKDKDLTAGEHEPNSGSLKKFAPSSYLTLLATSFLWSLFVSLFFSGWWLLFFKSALSLYLAGIVLPAVFFVIHVIKLAILKEPLVWSDFLLVKEMYSHPQLYFAYVPKKAYLAMVIAALVLVLMVAGAEINQICYLTPGVSIDPDTSIFSTDAGEELRILIVLSLMLTGITGLILIALYTAVKKVLSYDAARDGAVIGPNTALLAQLGERCFYKNRILDLIGSLHKLSTFKLDDSLMIKEFDTNTAGAWSKAGTGSREDLGYEAGSRPLTRDDSVVLIQAESYVKASSFKEIAPLEIETVSQAQGKYASLDIGYRGAYTMRSEFQVLTGIDNMKLGIYSYDPYLLAQKVKIRSLADLFKSRGFTTVCIHPNNKEFFSRDKVMKNLGFDHLIFAKELAGLDRNGPHISDFALCEYVKDLINKSSTALFVFVITMEAHGPWLKGRFKDRDDLTAVQCYGRHLKSLDKGLMLLKEHKIHALVYGDHEPALGLTNEGRKDPGVIAINLPLKLKGRIKPYNLGSLLAGAQPECHSF